MTILPPNLKAALMEIVRFSQSEECHNLQVIDYPMYLKLCALGNLAEALNHETRPSDSSKEAK
jgi:hypothetical protein